MRPFLREDCCLNAHHVVGGPAQMQLLALCDTDPKANYLLPVPPTYRGGEGA